MRNEIAVELKKNAVKILRLVIPQQILTFVMTNIVFDNITDHAKPLSICLLATISTSIKTIFSVCDQRVTIAWHVNANSGKLANWITTSLPIVVKIIYSVL